jgi:hypothetical protein
MKKNSRIEKGDQLARIQDFGHDSKAIRYSIDQKEFALINICTCN